MGFYEKIIVDIQKTSYVFEIGATDLGSPIRSAAAAALVNITVTDLNDNPPQILMPDNDFKLTLPTMQGK